MIRAYLFALDPTDAQAEAMRSHCGAARVAYNWCLARVKANWAQRAAEQTYGLSGDQLTPQVALAELAQAEHLTKTGLSRTAQLVANNIPRTHPVGGPALQPGPPDQG